MAQEQPNPNIACVRSAGTLNISARDGSVQLTVPLSVACSTDSSAINVFEGGIVWEDTSYLLSFEYQTTTKIRRATLSVNDHNELSTTASHEKVMFGGAEEYTHAHVVDNDKGDWNSETPFALTCGFARVQIRIEFFEEPDVFLTTPDIVSLDEPVRDGQTGERAEEANVREMHKALTGAQGNQAAEWMFAQGKTTLLNKRLAFDKNTDWAYASFSQRMEVASNALHCIFDGLEDTSDAFPTSLADDAHPGRTNRNDTDENRQVRALIASMEDQTRRMCGTLRATLGESRELHNALKRLMRQQGSRRGHAQSLPALAMIAQHVEREEQLCTMAEDLLWRIEEMRTFVEDPGQGFGIVEPIPFSLPEQTGVFATDATYSQLYEAMRTWSICAGEPLERMDISLHAVKPDKLFEYSALHKMLDWLWVNGFEEDVSEGAAITRYHYSLEDRYDKYENEQRCANTYRLVRKDAPDADPIRVVLYYQPVLYLGEQEENGIDLHRVPRATREEDDSNGDFWTPDYLLVIRQHGAEKTYLIDAKYCSARHLDAKMRDCYDKYIARAAKGNAEPGTGIDGIALVAGRLDAPELDVTSTRVNERTLLQIIAPFNKNAGRCKMEQFFDALGVPPRT